MTPNKWARKIRVFWSRVNKQGAIHPILGHCWEWTGRPMKNGYGKYGVLVHRLSYMMHTGPIPIGMSVLHKCDNRKCVNPDHLFIGTQQDNLRDMRDKDRQVRGEDQGSSKLTEDAVREIRRRYQRYSHTDGGGALAKEYGVGVVQIHRIVTGKAWKHV